MCGLSGFVAGKGRLLKGVILADMTRIINHRGPDDEGFILCSPNQNVITAGGETTPPEVWKTRTDFYPEYNIKEAGNQFFKVAFGHKRLSILDLSPSGHQPMSYRNGRYWIVFNGEIYNYQEIRIKLESLGHEFKTNSDTETILAAYSEWGEGCLEKLAGMWAFAIFDVEMNEIFLARDRYGIKPMYYYFSPEEDFYFASEIKQFTVLNGWQSKMNPQRAYDQLVYSFTDHTDETMFKGVFQLPGGTCFKSSLSLIAHDFTGRINLKRWYSLKRDQFQGTFNEAVSSFRTLFDRAVIEHLHADVTVGTALSGGLDSSSIVCEVNRILTANGTEALQKTFSSCSTDERFNEKKWMDIVINHTKVDAHYIFPGLSEALNITSNILWHHDEPYQSQSAYLGYDVFKLASSNGVKVLLNGQGADEYLGGYGQFTVSRYANMVKHLRLQALFADVKKLQGINQTSKSSLLLKIFNHLMPPVIKQGFRSINSSYDEVKKIIDINRLNIKPVHPFDSIPVSYSSVPEISEHLTFFSTLPKYLHWEDRNSMAHSVEARVPFLDHRLVEFAYNLPEDFLEKDGINKRVMRAAMKDLIPDKIMNRKDKMGFSTPEELWVKHENPKIFRDKISEAISVTDGIIKPGALNYFDNVISGKLPFDYTYWRLILFGEWVQLFRVKI